MDVDSRVATDAHGVDLLPAQAMVTPARKIERLEKQTDMKVVAGARFFNSITDSPSAMILHVFREAFALASCLTMSAVCE